MLINDYLKNRAYLNHDFLLNRYLTFLKVRKDMPLNDTESTKTRILEWFDYYDKLLSFISNLEMSLSPTQLFDIKPLNSIPINLEWLSKLTHEVYCRNLNIHDKCKALEELTIEINTIVIDISVTEINNNKLNLLFSRCKDLTTAISSLPTTIIIL